MTDAETYADAAAHTRAAADAAPPSREFDIRTFKPVRGDHLEAVIKALQSMQDQLDQLVQERDEQAAQRPGKDVTV
ncbi:hypothetical protein DY218_27395 [Streptomyces triticagri]|uniref:Uncharacterized protein n=1 Tax=Streptomyces triticagri TaxID=2293568 RepID=A0A372LZF0_9ACTN|nr:hypothetical protein [Streptomyces triticagri]RFU83635.1 hypothetical protein DY218_27395 [Streptomyces triticagri]